IVTASDDRTVRLWRYSETKAWEVDSFRGHTNNVSCAIFHPRAEYILSNGEDKSIRVWDMNKRSCVATFSMENFRFWVLSVHPSLNMFVAGHDGGMMSFKIERERPAVVFEDNKMIYVKDKFIRMINVDNGNDVVVGTIRETGKINNQPRKISYNGYEKTILISTQGNIDYVQLEENYREGLGSSEVKNIQGNSGVFVSKNKFCYFEGNKLIVRNVRNEIIKTIEMDNEIRDLASAATNQVVVIFNKMIKLIDLTNENVVGENEISGVKHVIWSRDGSKVAVLTKDYLNIFDKDLKKVCSFQEHSKLKSGIWRGNNLFLYSTLTHLKYATIYEDNEGIIKTIESRMYLGYLNGDEVYCLDRKGEMKMMKVDLTECEFKLALQENKYEKMMEMINSGRLIGQSVISYLWKQGYPEIALMFVKEPKSRFELGIESGNLQVSFEAAEIINKEEFWHKLSQEALKQGNVNIYEICLQKIKNFEKLNFFYSISGNLEKLKKMKNVLNFDESLSYQNALLRGNILDQIEILKRNNQNALACLMAKNYGIEIEINQEKEKSIKVKDQLIVPPI
ncbi:hypothetical protein ROZALSC1DRAFT_1279, partial [Rozella allomycis CSF55]